MMSKPSLLILAGPTASGKTAIACEIAKRLSVEIISCDSMQVYRGMPILTQAAFPAGAALSSFLDPSQEYNAALFRRDAMGLLHAILEKDKIPLIVGGTGLYLRALLDGLFDSEESSSKDETYRQELLSAQKENGGHYLHAALEKVDAASAARIHPNDLRRLVRALEVFHLTREPFSVKKQNRLGLREKFFHRVYFIDRDRADLYERINRRVDAMMQEGLLEEVKGLTGQNMSRTASMALGFREMRDHLEGRLTLSEAAELLKKNTRNYAKRQVSWFRHEKGVIPIAVRAGDPAEKVADQILNDFTKATA